MGFFVNFLRIRSDSNSHTLIKNLDECSNIGRYAEMGSDQHGILKLKLLYSGFFSALAPVFKIFDAPLESAISVIPSLFIDILYPTHCYRWF